MPDTVGSIRVIMGKEKETANTVRFKEPTKPGVPPKIGTLYVPKTTLEKLGNPEAIVVVLELEK